MNCKFTPIIKQSNPFITRFFYVKMVFFFCLLNSQFAQAQLSVTGADAPQQCVENAGDVATFIMNIGNSGPIIPGSVSIDFELFHSWKSDVEIILCAPDGTTCATIKTDDTGGGNDLGNTAGSAYAGVYTFEDGTGNGTIDPSADSAPGSYDPASPFSIFDGIDAQGDWTLTFSDDAGGDDGCIQNVLLSMDITECPELLVDLNPQFSDICDGQSFRLGVTVTQALRDLIDPDCSGIPFDEDLIVFGYVNTPGSFPPNPYLTGLVTTVGAANILGGTTQNLPGDVCDYETILNNFAVPAHGGGCDPEQRVIYAYLDVAVANALGLPATCLPFVSEVLTIWPDPDNHDAISVSYDGCLASLEAACPDMIVNPKTVNIADATSTTVNVTVSGGNGSPCATTTSTATIVNPSFDPIFSLDDIFCEDTAPITLNLTNPPAAADLPPGVTLDDVIEWQSNDGVVDNSDGTGTFTVPTAGGDPVPGIYTICVNVGLTGCTESHCETIEVKESVTATIVNTEICITSLPTLVDLTVMFSESNINPTDLGGIFTLVGGSGTADEESNYIWEITALPTAHSSGTQSGTFNFEYTVSSTGTPTASACNATDPGTLTVRFIPNPVFDSPSFVCSAETDANLLDMNNYLVDANVMGTGTWTSSCAGLISAAGVVDPTAASDGTICSITFTSDDPPGTTCPMTTHTEYIYIEDCAAGGGIICEGLDDLTPSVLTTCDGTNIQMSVQIGADIVALLDDTANGGDGNGSFTFVGIEQTNLLNLLQVGIATTSGGLVVDPYINNPFYNVLGSASGLSFGTFGTVTNPFVTLNIPVPHSGTDVCVPENYVVVTWLDPAQYIALGAEDTTGPAGVPDGVPDNCTPYEWTTVTVHPDPANIPINVNYANCIAYFEADCPGYTVSPSLADVVSNTGSTVSLTVGNEFCDATVNSPIIATPIVPTATACTCNNGNREVQLNGINSTTGTSSESGSGGASFTGNPADGTNIAINFPAGSVPAGATITSTDVVISFTTLGGSFQSELRVNVVGPLGNVTGIQPGTGSGGTTTDAPLGVWAGDPTGLWTFSFWESFNDGGAAQDANITDITITVNWVLPPNLTFNTVGGMVDATTNIFTLDGSSEVWSIVVIDNNTGCETLLSGSCPIEEPHILGSSGPFCEGDRGVQYTIDGGYTGTWSIVGAGAISSSGFFTPSSSGAAAITFTPDADQLDLACGTDPISINTYISPIIDGSFTVTDVCQSDLPLTLSLDNPLPPVTLGPIFDGAVASGSLDATDPSYTRCGSFFGSQFYDAVEFQVTTADTYTFEVTSTNFDGYATIYSMFDPNNSCNDRVAFDDDGGPGLSPSITTALAPGCYVLVTTTFSAGITGAYTWDISSAGANALNQGCNMATWQGNGISDNGDNTATFNPANPGVYTICNSVGSPMCATNICHTISVYEDANATILDYTICEDDKDFNLTSLFVGGTTTTGGIFTIDCDGPGGDDPVIVSGNEIVTSAVCAPMHTTGSGMTNAPAPVADEVGIIAGSMDAAAGFYTSFTPAAPFAGDYFFLDEDAIGGGVLNQNYILDLGTFDLSDADECSANPVLTFDYTYRRASFNEVFQVLVNGVATPINPTSAFGTDGTLGVFTLALPSATGVTIQIEYNDNGVWGYYHAYDNISITYGTNLANTGNDLIYLEDFSSAAGGSYAAPVAAPAASAATTLFEVELQKLDLQPGTCEVTYIVGNDLCGASNTANLTITPSAAFASDAMTVCAEETLNLNPTTTGGTWTVDPPSGGTVDAAGVFTPASDADGLFEVCYTFETPTNPCGPVCTKILVQPSTDATITDVTICEDDKDFNLSAMFTTNTTSGGNFTIDCGAGPINLAGTSLYQTQSCPISATTEGSGGTVVDVDVASQVFDATHAFWASWSGSQFYGADDDAFGNGPSADFTYTTPSFDVLCNDAEFCFDFRYRDVNSGDFFLVEANFIDINGLPQTLPLVNLTSGNVTVAASCHTLPQGTNYSITFTYDDGDVWAWFVGIDNLLVTDGAGFTIYEEDFEGATVGDSAPAPVAPILETGTVNNQFELTPGTCTVTYAVGGNCNESATANLTITPSAAFRPDAMTVCAEETLNLNPTTTGGTWTVDPPSGGTVDAAGVFSPAANADGLFEVCYTFGTAINPCGPVCTKILVQPSIDPTIFDQTICSEDALGFNLTSLFIGGQTTPGGTFCIDLDDGNGPININGDVLSTAGVQVVGDASALANATICDAAFGGLSNDDGTLPFATWINGFTGDPFLFFDDDEFGSAAPACGASVAFATAPVDITGMTTVDLEYIFANITGFGNVFEVWATWNGGANSALLQGNLFANPLTLNLDVLALAPAAAGATDLIIEFRWDDSNVWAWGFALDDIVLTGDGAELFSEDFQVESLMPLTIVPGDTYEITYKVGGNCQETATADLTIIESPTVNFDIPEQYCWDGGDDSILPIVISNMASATATTTWTISPSPAGVIDSATGEIDVDASGAGTFTITMTTSETVNGITCSDSESQAITITQTDVALSAAWTSFGPLCEDDATVDLTATVTGDADGVFTGTGVSGTHPNYTFDPTGLGGQTISVCYTVNNGSGCTASECHNIEVAPEVFADLADTQLECVTNPSGNISLDALFITDGSIAGGNNTTTGGAFAMSGVFTGSGSIVGNTLSYGTAGCYCVDYTVTSIDGATSGACHSTATACVYISEEPQPSFDLTEAICWDGSVGVTINPLVNSPTYSSTITTTATWAAWTVGTGNSAAPTAQSMVSIDATTGEITILAAGTVDICYTESNDLDNCNGVDADPCVETICHTLNITETSEDIDASWTTFGLICEDDAIVDLTATVTGDADGVFTGTGVSGTHPNYTFDPTGLGGQTISICYTINSGAGCTAAQCQNIEVAPAVFADLNDIHLECITNPAGNISLNALFVTDNSIGETSVGAADGSNTTAGGVFTTTATTGANIVGNTLTYSAAGCYEINYTVTSVDGATSGVCYATATAYVLVSEQPQPSFDIQDAICLSAGDGIQTFIPNVSSPTYTNAVSNSWAVIDNLTNATVTIDNVATSPTFGHVTITPDASAGAISGTYTIALTETISYASCGTIPAGDCEETFSVVINAQDGTTLDPTFTIDNDEPCPNGSSAGATTVNLDPVVDGGVFTGVGVTDNGMGTGGTFIAPTCGTFEVTYTLGNVNGCTNSYTLNITTDRTAPDITTLAMDETVECDGAGNAGALATWLANNGGAIATDNCNTPVWTYELINTISACGGASEREYRFTATDGCENTSSTVASFIIQDTANPTISTVVDLTIDCSAISGTTDPTLLIEDWINTNYTANDICGDVAITHDYVAAILDVCLASTTTVTWTATDECGNSETATSNLIIIPDTEDPTFTTAPTDLTLNTDVNCEAVLPDYTTGSNTVTMDNCDNQVAVSQTPPAGTVITLGTTLITLTATDDCGNSAQTTFNAVIEDATAPVAVCQDIQVELDANGMVTITAADIDGGSFDNCDANPAIAIDITTFDCSNVGTNTVTLTVTDAAGNSATCTAEVTVLNNVGDYELSLDVPEICLPAAASQLDFSNYLTITDGAGNEIDPNVLAATYNAVWSIENFDGTGAAGSINPTTGVYTPGTGSGFVTIRYTLSQPQALCDITVENVFELRQPLVFSPGECMCDALPGDRVVVLGTITDGLAPYTVQVTGASNAALDTDNDGSYTVATDGGDAGTLLVNDGETNWSVTVVDSRGCEIFHAGQCDPLLNAPIWIGGNSPACFTDGIFDIQLSNSNYDFVTADISIVKLDNADIDGGNCENHTAFNAATDFTDVFFIDDSSDEITIVPENLIGDDYRYAGTYRITLTIPPSEETECQPILVEEEITLYPSFDACFQLPLEICGNTDVIRIDVNEFNPGYDDLSPDLLCRDLDEMSVWELIAPNGTVIGTGTAGILLQEGDLGITGMMDGDLELDPSVLYDNYGIGIYTLNHELGIDICKTSCAVTFQILEFPRAEASTPMPIVCQSDEVMLKVDTIYAGAWCAHNDPTPRYRYQWSLGGTTISPIFDSNDPVSCDIFTIDAATLPGAPLATGVYTFTLTVQDCKGCVTTVDVDVAINADPVDAPIPTNTIFCQSNKASGTSPIHGTNYSSSVLSVDCSAACANIVAPAGIAIPAPSVNWYDSATSTTPLFDADINGDWVYETDLDGNPSTFDPVAAGLVDADVPGVYSFWAECVCIPDAKCVSPRVEVKITVLDCGADDGECTYLLVLEDAGDNGWDGASIDVSINNAWPADNYKVPVNDACGHGDILIIPITANDGGYFDLNYWNGAFESDHSFTVLDPLGNIAIDENGNPVQYNGTPPVGQPIRVKLDCPVQCNDSEDFFVGILMGANPDDQSWEIRDGDTTRIASAEALDYSIYSPGQFIIDTTLTLNGCEDYTFTAFDAAEDGWNGGEWYILSTNPSRGIPGAANTPLEGYYIIASGPDSGMEYKDSHSFTLPCFSECPADQLAFVDSGDCDIDVFTPPAISPFVCYPNCTHGVSPGPQVVITLTLADGTSTSGTYPTTFADVPAGSHTLTYMVVYNDGQRTRCTTTLDVGSLNNPVLACNDLVHISLDDDLSTQDCITTVTPDMVLEDLDFACPGELVVEVEAPNGTNIGNVLTSEYAGDTLNYKVIHIGTNNFCWGQLIIEDKLAPVLDCTTYEIACNHPEALNHDYTHTEIFTPAASEMPANIAGSAWNVTTVNILGIGCAPLGEIIKDVELDVAITHTRPADLQYQLCTPSGVCVNPYDANDLATLNGLPYNSVDGNWQLIILDTDGTAVNGDVGKGRVDAVSLTITAGFPTTTSYYDCTDVTFELLDQTFMETDCDQSEWYGAKIIRTWQAVDAFGNSSTCVQEIGLKAPQMNDIDVPSDINIECGTEELDANGDVTTTQAGFPQFDCFEVSNEQHQLCDISIAYEDQTLPSCGSGYKVIRTWTILNWCTGVSKVFEQTIKIEDTTGPAININDIVVDSSPYDCETGAVLLSPAVTDACAGIQQITATYTVGGGFYNPSGTLVIVDITDGAPVTDLPFGLTQIEIHAQDICGNVTNEIIDLNVADNAPPIAICDDELHVSLGSDGSAWLSAEDVDEGSYDNCSAITLEVRRTDGCLGESDWGTHVAFECCDINEYVTVELRVTDAGGNSNVCWKQVLVEDALAPVITCPADKTLDCDDDAIHDPFDEAEAIDNCSNVTLSFEDSGELDQCKAGTLTRTWTATDGSDKSADVTCTQSIEVVSISDFIVQFPADVSISSCPDSLSGLGMPVISDDDCELIAISHEDLVLTVVDDACYKVERTWTVINWCIYDEGNPNNTDLGIPQPLPRTYQDDDGYFTYVQTIKVLDSEAPSIDNPGDLEFCDLTDGCEGHADLIVYPSDECSNYFFLEYTHKIDLDNNGSFDIIDEGQDASGIYPYGTHRIKWIVEDGCGNTSEMTHLFTVKDCKNPTPVCLSGISIENMQTGCVDIWAADLLEYAFDNCSSDAYVEASVKMRRAGTNDVVAQSITLCCEDIGTILVEIWVEDEAGNTDFCTTYIVVQDNQGACNGGSVARIEGLIYTEDGEMVEEAMVELEGGMQDQMPTAEDGNYFFDVPMNNDYTITPTSDKDPLNGVSTFDLVLMSQHILGFTEFTSPYQMIAADVNSDGIITTFDIVQLRQLILFVISDLPSNTSWRFVDADYSFPIPTNPWFETFPEAINHTNLAANQLADDFIAVKIGDVNGDVVANSLTAVEERNTTRTLEMIIDDAKLKEGDAIAIDFKASDFENINGYQFTLNFDASAMNFAGIEANALTLSEANFGLTLLNEGVITSSWSSSEAKNLADDAILFTLHFEMTDAIQLSNALNMDSRYTKAEAYSGSELLDVALLFANEDELVQTDKFELYQNTPNPFKGETIIGFNLPTASAATLTIMDVTGKTLQIIEGDYAKGFNQVAVKATDLKATGVLYYQVETPSHSITKKMIVLD